jgi:hypothetical protein
MWLHRLTLQSSFFSCSLQKFPQTEGTPVVPILQRKKPRQKVTKSSSGDHAHSLSPDQLLLLFISAQEFLQETGSMS